jgi:2,5-diamino-6-(ribosylamino)-4(3H)-pyrimidinone 5'-phosphate reductase
MPKDVLVFPESERPFLEPYLLPPNAEMKDVSLPFVTLTFATSLDSSLSIAPGVRTVLSGPQSKAMTHYLRSRHDAILIGVGTAVADNPGLNCRIQGVGGYGGGDNLQGQPRPVIIDPTARWGFTEDAQVLQLARNGCGRAPYILTLNPSPPTKQRQIREEHGGKFITLDITTPKTGHDLHWTAVLETLKKEGLNSVMVEGGSGVINTLLEPSFQALIDSVIITIAPTWLGQGGVVVSPKRRFDAAGNAIPASRLTNVKWHPFGEDVVLCGRIKP